MTKKAEEHLQRIKATFITVVDYKYRKGQKEHGGFMPDMGIEMLLIEALDEAVDQVVYLQTALDSIKAERLKQEGRSKNKVGVRGRRDRQGRG